MLNSSLVNPVKYISVNLLHIWNELSIENLSPSIVTDVRLLQFWKAAPPMLVTLLGMVMDVRPLQFMKAEPTMSVTLLGMVIDVMLVRPEKAALPMYDTVLGIIVFLHPAIK